MSPTRILGFYPMRFVWSFLMANGAGCNTRVPIKSSTFSSINKAATFIPELYTPEARYSALAWVRAAC